MIQKYQKEVPENSQWFQVPERVNDSKVPELSQWFQSTRKLVNDFNVPEVRQWFQSTRSEKMIPKY